MASSQAVRERRGWPLGLSVAYLSYTFRHTDVVTQFASSAIQRLTGLEPFPQPGLIRTKYPVVLMHGFGLLASLRRGGMLHDMALYLRSHGVWAYAPNVAPYNTVAVRAAMWEDRIRTILTETGASKVHLIAHSMGGLDARYLVSVRNLHAHVASVTTISTPHHGSSIANLVLAQPERFRSLAADLVDWVGIHAMQGTESDVHQAVAELTTEHMVNVFNPAVPDHPDVLYGSYAGSCGRGTPGSVNPLLTPLNLFLYAKEGVNDGYVSVDSARWGTFHGCIDADHLRQIGLQLTSGSSPFAAGPFFVSVVKRLTSSC